MLVTGSVPTPDALVSVAMGTGVTVLGRNPHLGACGCDHRSSHAGLHDPHVWSPEAPRPPR